MAKKKIRRPIRKSFTLGKRGRIFLGVLAGLFVLALASMFTGTQLGVAHDIPKDEEKRQHLGHKPREQE